MRKDLLLREIASEAYGVGYTAKLHFATMGLADKLPGWISLVSIAVGILALVFPVLGTPLPSAMLLILGVVSLYCRHYEERRDDYDSVGKAFTEQFGNLRSLLNDVVALDANDVSGLARARGELSSIRASVRDKSISRQMVAASWFAHHAFFWASEMKWIEEYRDRPFTLFRDKLPLSFTVTLALILASFAACVVCLILWYACLGCL